MRFGKRSTIIGTKELHDFKKRVHIYGIRNQEIIQRAIHQVSEWINDGFVIKFDLYVLLTEDQIFTKTKKAKSKYKRLDVDNRIKAIRDSVAELVKVDDTIFFSGNTEKAIGDKQCVIISMMKTTIKTQAQAMATMALSV